MLIEDRETTSSVSKPRTGSKKVGLYYKRKGFRIGRIPGILTSYNHSPCRHSGFRPGDPNPNLLSPDEAVRYLRLDEIDTKNPNETLERYRKLGRLKATQVSKRLFYLRSELDQFLETQTVIVKR
jgi:hypothetical protein